jgi:hypothetical protein
VHVVTTGVHDRHVTPFLIDTPHRTGIVKPRVFFDGKGIHVGTQENGWSGAIHKHANDAGAADAREHLKAETPQFALDYCRSAVFLKRQLRMRVQIPIDVFEMDETIVQT